MIKLFKSRLVDPKPNPLHSPMLEPVKELNSPILKSSPNILSKFSATQQAPGPEPQSYYFQSFSIETEFC